MRERAVKLSRAIPVARTARVEGGATLGRLDHETQAFGLAAPAGVMSKTGIAGRFWKASRHNVQSWHWLPI